MIKEKQEQQKVDQEAGDREFAVLFLQVCSSRSRLVNVSKRRFKKLSELVVMADGPDSVSVHRIDAHAISTQEPSDGILRVCQKPAPRSTIRSVQNADDVVYGRPTLPHRFACSR